MLSLYVNLPFDTPTNASELDLFTAAGAGPYQLVNKPATDLSALIQAGNLQYRQTGTPPGFTKDTLNNRFTLASAPPPGAIIIAQGIIRLILKAYDQTTIAGLSTPNISITPIYIVDTTEIANRFYTNTFGKSHVQCQVVDNDTSYGADAGWCQLGLATPATGLPTGTWGTAGDPVNLPDIGTYSPLAVNASVGATSLTVADGTQFPITTTGFIQLDTGLSTEEDVQVFGVSGNVLTVGPTTYAHLSGNNVYFIGVKAFIQTTLPTGLGAVTYVDLSTDLIFDEIDR